MGKRGNKGVSPIVATVLLIGMVIAIGVIIFLWVRGFVKEEGQKNGQNVQLVCQQVDFDATYSGGLLGISNVGNIPLFRLKIKEYKAGGFVTKDITELSSTWASVGLKQGEVFSDSIGSTSGVTKILVVPVLLATTGSGSIAHTCDDTYGKTISL
ncbi:MAG TPA: archaellin/type IV pilin N-terminal domain-containing protein [Patescibacteria group bacterium]|nr:archaellin/type IV pilin N-terminal domain-containing protein [Patescibacteria group bacterium]